MTFYIQVEQ
ncbi:UNVERIFIED_CONTAM: hypothetical protein GTU68_067178 [Idotea baltica]|nr:hypothetical protein [Idotea baltica]